MADETNVLDQLIGQILDESLRGRLAREVELLRGSRRFGLVFDRHLPESVRLADHPIRKGIRVALRDESRAETWTVQRFTDRTREVAVLDGDGGEQPVSDLIVVREFGEPIYPGLHSVERIANGSEDAPWHVVINGENFHALQALRSTHREKVDLIYIDPPYNTGNDGWIYNDRYVDQNDRAKSSKWLSFMERRLLIARDLLKPTGVVIAAIGDEEHHRLRMLLDQIFGPDNFLADVVWQGGRKNDARYVSTGADYMLIFARAEEVLTQAGTRWRERKPGAETALAAAAEIWKESEGNHEMATKRWREWMRDFKKEGIASDAVTRFVTLDADGRPIRIDGNLRSPNPRRNLQYDLLHPVTQKPVKMHPNGWVYARDRMDELVAEGRVVFGKDHTVTANFKRYLDDSDDQAPLAFFASERATASRYLAAILGDRRFPNPKGPDVLMRWIDIVAPSDAVVLDFFGGSGTTTEAVMRLNAADGGTRQSILVTNNEVGAAEAKRLRSAELHPGDSGWEERGVFEYVCRPRISTVVTGIRPNGTVFSDGLEANVELFNLTYLDPALVRRGHEFAAVAPLMWLEGGAVGEPIDSVPEQGWALTDAYGALFDVDSLAAFATAVADTAAAGAPPRMLFVITDSPAEYQQAVERLPVGVETVQLYEDYLSNYTINTAGGAR